MSLDGSTQEFPDEADNWKHFGLLGAWHGRADFPKLNLTVLMEIDTDTGGQVRSTGEELGKGRAEHETVRSVV